MGVAGLFDIRHFAYAKSTISGSGVMELLKPSYRQRSVNWGTQGAKECRLMSVVISDCTSLCTRYATRRGMYTSIARLFLMQSAIAFALASCVGVPSIGGMCILTILTTTLGITFVIIFGLFVDHVTQGEITRRLTQ